MTEYKGYTALQTTSGIKCTTSGIKYTTSGIKYTTSGETLYGHLSDSDAVGLAYFSRDRKTGEIHHACLGKVLNL